MPVFLDSHKIYFEVVPSQVVALLTRSPPFNFKKEPGDYVETTINNHLQTQKSCSTLRWQMSFPSQGCRTEFCSSVKNYFCFEI